MLVSSAEYDHCIVASCIAVPFLIWIAWDVVAVGIASFFTVYGEVCNDIFLFFHILICTCIIVSCFHSIRIMLFL